MSKTQQHFDILKLVLDAREPYYKPADAYSNFPNRLGLEVAQKTRGMACTRSRGFVHVDCDLGTDLEMDAGGRIEAQGFVQRTRSRVWDFGFCSQLGPIAVEAQRKVADTDW